MESNFASADPTTTNNKTHVVVINTGKKLILRSASAVPASSEGVGGGIVVVPTPLPTSSVDVVSYDEEKQNKETEEKEKKKRRRAMGFWWCCFVLIVAVIAIGAGVGTSVSTKKGDSSSSTSLPFSKAVALKLNFTGTTSEQVLVFRANISQAVSLPLTSILVSGWTEEDNATTTNGLRDVILPYPYSDHPTNNGSAVIYPNPPLPVKPISYVIKIILDLDPTIPSNVTQESIAELAWADANIRSALVSIADEIDAIPILPTTTPTPTTTPSNSPTASVSPTSSISSTPSHSPTSSNSPTPSISPTPSNSPTSSNSPTPSVSPTPSNSNSPTPSTSSTPSNSPTPSISPTPSNSNSPTPSTSSTPSNSPTPSISPTPSDSPSNSPTPSVTPSDTPSISPTPSNSLTPSNSVTPTSSISPTPSPSPSNPPCYKVTLSTGASYNKGASGKDLTSPILVARTSGIKTGPIKILYGPPPSSTAGLSTTDLEFRYITADDTGRYFISIVYATNFPLWRMYFYDAISNAWGAGYITLPDPGFFASWMTDVDYLLLSGDGSKLLISYKDYTQGGSVSSVKIGTVTGLSALATATPTITWSSIVGIGNNLVFTTIATSTTANYIFLGTGLTAYPFSAMMSNDGGTSTFSDYNLLCKEFADSFITDAGSLFVACGTEGLKIASSINAPMWSNVHPVTSDWRTVAMSSNSSVLVASTFASSLSTIWVSKDRGVTWAKNCVRSGTITKLILRGDASTVVVIYTTEVTEVTI